MNTTTRAVATSSFELRIGSRPPWTVQSMRGREALSRLFSFDVVVTAEHDDDLSNLVGERATLVFDATGSRSGGPSRVVHGVVASARIDGAVGHSQRRSWTVRVAPHL